MLALERHRRILDLLAVQGSVRTIEVAQALDVTDETVRRDFEKLEADGQLIRSHGGAIRGEASRRDLPFTSREAMNVAGKQAIAQRALGHIEPGDTILLDASSTTLELARRLPDAPLTVLTNAVKIAIELAGRPFIQVVLIGGAVDARSLSCVGPLAENVLDCYHVRTLFLSCRGMDAQRGLSESNEGQSSLKRKALALADRAILLVDHSKLGLRSSFFFARLQEIEVLITDRPPATAFAKALRKAEVEVQIAAARRKGR
ncbi:MAG: DeoR/GlpR family DNA-binding transcription regulator [Terrimicrobiaceae bacterium]|nr:DeoR/GlpR family DNA-binding transcription regulator [Terrimicrobiaceae bacterium]